MRTLLSTNNFASQKINYFQFRFNFYCTFSLHLGGVCLTVLSCRYDWDVLIFLKDKYWGINFFVWEKISSEAFEARFLNRLIEGASVFSFLTYFFSKISVYKKIRESIRLLSIKMVDQSLGKSAWQKWDWYFRTFF